VWRGRPTFDPGSYATRPASSFCPSSTPRSSEAIFDKITFSAFEGTPLDIALRDCGITAFAICGVAMEIGIEPTVRHGADLGYIPIIVTDACGARRGGPASRGRARGRGRGCAQAAEGGRGSCARAQLEPFGRARERELERACRMALCLPEHQLVRLMVSRNLCSHAGLRRAVTPQLRIGEQASSQLLHLLPTQGLDACCVRWKLNLQGRLLQRERRIEGSDGCNLAFDRAQFASSRGPSTSASARASARSRAARARTRGTPFRHWADGEADPVFVRPRLGEAAAASLDEIKRVLVET
jgi:hypothetical protein